MNHQSDHFVPGRGRVYVWSADVSGSIFLTFIRRERARSASEQPVYIFAGMGSPLFSQSCLDQWGQDKWGNHQEVIQMVELIIFFHWGETYVVFEIVARPCSLCIQKSKQNIQIIKQSLARRGRGDFVVVMLNAYGKQVHTPCLRPI